MPQLKIFLLGSTRLERAGKLVETDTRKAFALLAYLLVTGQTHTRDELAAFFWPELDHSHARGALRRTLSALKSAIGSSVLETSREAISLNLDQAIWSDYLEFRKLIQIPKNKLKVPSYLTPEILESLRHATELFRADFMSGFSLRDSVAFDDWQFFQSENLRRELVGALELLVDGHTGFGDFETAIPYARRWLSLEPLQEEAHRALMILFNYTGRREAALRQYKVCVKTLDKELGVPPLEKTVNLYLQIKENKLAAPSKRENKGSSGFRNAVPQTRKPEIATLEGVLKGPSNHERQSNIATISHSLIHLPLVGRSDEFELLLKEYASVQTNARLVVIEGEAGVGKTRLSEEFLAHATAAGAMTISARAYQGENTLSYGPFIEGLRTAINVRNQSQLLGKLEEETLKEVTRLLPELSQSKQVARDLPLLDDAGAQIRFFEAMHRFILELTQGPVPGTLFIDDLQWVDSATADLLTYLIRRSTGKPMLILVTWRGEEIPSNHRFRQLLAETQRTSRGTIISLTRLNLIEVKQLLDSLNNSVLSESLGDRLFRETEGLPYFINEYLAANVKTEDSWENVEWPLPGTIQDLIRFRLSQVSELGMQLLSTAAAIGRSFDYETLWEASGRGEDEVILGLEELLDKGLITEDNDQGGNGSPIYYFNHEKLRSVVYEQISTPRRRLLHRRISNALLNLSRSHTHPAPLAGLIAFHFLQAGENGQSANYFRMAGDYARSVYANHDAIVHYQSALDLGYPQKSQLYEAIGDLQILLGDYSAALKNYAKVCLGNEDPNKCEVEHKQGKVFHRLGEWDRAEEKYRLALSCLREGSPAGTRVRILSDWSLVAHRQQHVQDAHKLAKEALDCAAQSEDLLAEAEAHNILGIIARSEGDLDGSQRHLEQSFSIANQLSNPFASAAALNNLALLSSEKGELDPAIRLTETALKLCQQVGDRHREAALESNLADLLHRAGKSDSAIEHLTNSVTILAEIGRLTGDLRPEIWKLTEW